MCQITGIQTECENTGDSHGRYQYLLLIACSIITNAVGLDMFGFSIVVAAAHCDLKLGVTETGVLASAPLAGVLFAYPWGYFADTRGRRRALLLSTVISFVFAAISSFSPTWQLMILFKLKCELHSDNDNSRRVHRVCLPQSVSLHHEQRLAYFLLPLQFSLYIPFLGINYRPWRLFTLVLALPLGIGGLMIAYLHESPKFLASRGDNKKALEVLKSMYAWNGGKQEEYPKASFWDSVVKQTVPIFKPPLLWRTLQLFYLMAICCSTNNAFVMWFPTIVNMFFNSFTAGWNTERTFCQRYVCNDTISTHTIISGISYGLFLCVLTLIVARVASRRRLVLIVWLAISGVSAVLVEVRQPVASLAFFVLLQSSIIGMPSLAAYCVDLYPTAYRGLVTSLGMMVARMFSLGGVNLVGAVITTNCSMTFYIWSIFVFSECHQQ
ncbi:putative SV2-like protein 1 [Operophtera brumata]|uniref:Putative SV2-like protein 1 n=1 Tax=Operophtera brumata TaxID=104452 RepID=A0A0L7LHZ8_OPEBR|nr:putative SV2-like protein 1 [Operophtera brumata]